MEATQYSNLIDFLTERFDSIEKRLELLEIGQENILRRLTGVETDQKKMLGRMDKVKIGQDKAWKAISDLSQELKVANYRSERVENWVVKAAKKIQLPYRP